MVISRSYSGLKDALTEARSNVLDNHAIWCMPSVDFQTTISYHTAAILGGTFSPQFLKDSRGLWTTPWTVRLWRPRMLPIHKAIAEVQDWLPMMEEIAKERGSLLIITEEIQEELLRTLIINFRRNALNCCAINAEVRQGSAAKENRYFERILDSPPREPAGLSQAGEAFIRRTATAIFPAPETKLLSSEKVAIISVGGQNCEDQQDRLRFLVRAIEQNGLG